MGTTSDNMFSAQTLIDRVRGRIRRKRALVGSALARGGAVRVLGTMPKGGKSAINKTIDVRYFGVRPKFQQRTETQSALVCWPMIVVQPVWSRRAPRPVT